MHTHLESCHKLFCRCIAKISYRNCLEILSRKYILTLFSINKTIKIIPMLRRYELTDEEWNRIAPLLPPENTGKQGRPQKCTRTILNGIVWIARSGAPWRDLPERYGAWQTVYSRFRKWIDDGIINNIFRVLSLDAELTELSIDASIVQAHQHSAGAKKGGLQTKSDIAEVEQAQKSMP